MIARWQRWRLLPRRDDIPFVAGNRVEILVDGGPFFRAVHDAIRSAERYVLMESYIYVADDTGWRIAEVLAERAKNGVEVAFSHDGFGSFSLDHRLINFLRDHGVKVLEYRPVSPFRGRWPWSKRDHRKTIIADGRVAIVGGMNISDDYAPIEDGGRGWRDTAVRIEGPAVRQVEAMFRREWGKNSALSIVSEPMGAPPFPGGHDVRFVGNEGRRNRADIRRAYLWAIFRAERSIRIMNAYFMPDRLLLRALCRAARRGVEVEIITAGATDVWPVLHASRGLYGQLLRAGVKIYEWHERILHAKTAVVDGVWSTIGSANLNNRTYLIDLEVNATILGPEVGGAMDDQFTVDRARSQAIERQLWKVRPLGQRLLEWFFGLFRRLI